MAITTTPDQKIIDFPNGMDFKENPAYADKVLLYDPETGKPVYTTLEKVQAQAAANVIGSAIPTQSPTGEETNGQSYRVSNTTGAEVTYTNFLTNVPDGSGGFLPVTQPDKTGGFLIKNTDGWVFSETPVDTDGLATKDDVDAKADKDKAMFIGETEEPTPPVNVLYGFAGTYPSVSNNVADFPNEGYIVPTTGAVASSTNYHWGEFDVSQASTVTIRGVVSTSAGYAFIREDGSFISGGTNDGSEHTIPVPGSAKWLRQSKNNSDDISICPVILTQTIMVEDNQFVLKRGSEIKKFTFPLRAANIIHDGDFNVNGYINKPGTYAIGETVIDPSTFTDGYVQKSNGAWLASGNFKVSDYLPLNGATIVKASGLTAATSAGVCFYKADLTFIGGYAMGASNSDISNYPVPYDLDGNIAALSRVTMANSDTTRSVKFIKQVTVMENQLAFIEDGEVSIWTGGSDSAKISGDELIAALPESDGSDIPVNDTYVNSTTGNVIKKLAL